MRRETSLKNCDKADTAAQVADTLQISTKQHSGVFGDDDTAAVSDADIDDKFDKRFSNKYL